VVERLNSLFEDNPQLVVYEPGEADTETFERTPSKRRDGSARVTAIHENFRLFCTANVARIHSQKLSTALMNRCVRLALPAIDWRLESQVFTEEWREHELYALCKHKLGGLIGGEEFAVRTAWRARQLSLCAAHARLPGCAPFMLRR
jgi:hypothetical protein